MYAKSKIKLVNINGGLGNQLFNISLASILLVKVAAYTF